MTVVASGFLSDDDIRHFVIYDFATGDVVWRRRPIEMFATKRSWASWNAKNAGKVAGFLRRDGYLSIRFNGKDFLLHRVIWFIIYGEWPDDLIDHKNGKRSDNHFWNLQVTDEQGNARNRKLPINNTSGFVGVRLVGDKWYAAIKIDQRRCHLGVFETFEEAVERRKIMEKAFGFSKRHGT
ncbi:HNH endonuclease [Agrobacterium phage OLIVR4]|nr:HNH endonuclease [Agrobacterium phage OLIVR4]